MRVITGDVIKAFENNEIDVLVHGCNCFCKMGAGIAKVIKQKYPKVYEADYKTKKGDREKLGTIGIVTYYHQYGNEVTIKYIVNAYTQFTYWNPSDMLSYSAISKCMQKIKKQFSNKKIGLPKIGCGLAGGDWKIVEAIIQKELDNEDVTIYKLN